MLNFFHTKKPPAAVTKGKSAATPATPASSSKAVNPSLQRNALTSSGKSQRSTPSNSSPNPVVSSSNSKRSTSSDKLHASRSDSILVKTVTRKKSSLTAAGIPSSSSPNGTSSSSRLSSPALGSTNALSDERRRRIAEDRRKLAQEAARKDFAQRELDHLEKRQRDKLASAAHASRNGSKQLPSRHNSDESSSLSEEDDTQRAKKRKRLGEPAKPEAYKKVGREGVATTYAVTREGAEPLPFQEACERRKIATEVTSSKELVRLTGRQRYAPFFRDLDEDMPCATLEYPAQGATEEFVLLSPKSTEEYDPIAELLRTVYSIMAGGYVTEQQRKEHFGSLDELEASSTAGQSLAKLDRLGSAHRKSATPSRSREGSQVPSRSPLNSSHSLPAIEEDAARAAMLAAAAQAEANAQRATPQPHGSDAPTVSSLTPSPRLERKSSPLAPSLPVADAKENFADGLPSKETLAVPMHPQSSASSGLQESILRSFTKARNRRDGPLFLRTLERFNSKLRTLKDDGSVVKNIQAHVLHNGVSELVWRNIQEQCYARAVGPKVEELSKYAAFSDNVYGELLPRFMSEIAQLCELKSDSVFLDLGSGVGNLLIQCALQTGCKALGCEIMERPCVFAEAQLKEARTRWAMWALKGGEMDSWRGDFCNDEKVGKALAEADVVLVNNYAFLPQTNDSLCLQFLDLKDGAHIISLKPFVPADFRLTERTLSSPLAILRVEERIHATGSVSWADRSGKYYIQTVDRSLIRQFYERRSGAK